MKAFVTKSALALSLTAALSWPVVPAHADRIIGGVTVSSAPTITVSYAELDINKPRGLEVLYSRIERAAKSVCNFEDSPRQLAQMRQAKACYRTFRIHRTHVDRFARRDRQVRDADGTAGLGRGRSENLHRGRDADTGVPAESWRQAVRIEPDRNAHRRRIFDLVANRVWRGGRCQRRVGRRCRGCARRARDRYLGRGGASVRDARTRAAPPTRPAARSSPSAE
jgi:UrcA family protein